MNDPASPVASPPSPQPEPVAAPKPGNPLKWIAVALITVVVLALVGYGGYWYGQRSAEPTAATQSVVANEIKIPSDATVTAECIDGLGKQYVVPKDIPFGPIYNVHDAKVIGVEYMFNVSELTKN